MAIDIINTRQDGDPRPTDDHNAVAGGLIGLGGVDDNGGLSWFPLGMDFPVPILSRYNPQIQVVQGGSTFTVPSGKIFIIRHIQHAASVNDVIQTVTIFSTANVMIQDLHCCLVLPAGAQAQPGVASFMTGVLMDKPLNLVAWCTPINSAGPITFTVPSISKFVLTAAISAAATAAIVAVGGVSAIAAQNLHWGTTVANTGNAAQHRFAPLGPFAPGQVLSVVSGQVLISGVELIQ